MGKKWVFAVEECFEELLTYKGNKEVYLSSREFSKESSISTDKLLELLNFYDRNDIPCILVVDIIPFEQHFQSFTALIQSLPLHRFKGLCLLDQGLIHWALRELPWLPLHAQLDSGFHNKVAFEWLKEKKIKRLFVSNEIPKKDLLNYLNDSTTQWQIRVFGPLLLFYTPRKLHSPLGLQSTLTAHSVESAHQGFMSRECAHGTLLYNVRDLDLTDEDLPLSLYLFVDLRHYDKELALTFFRGHPVKGPRPFFKGLFLANKTNVLFGKIKNKSIERKDDDYIGKIVDVERDLGVTLEIKRGALPPSYKLITPEGKIKLLESWKTIEVIGKGRYRRMAYLKGVPVGTQVYINRYD